MSTLKSVTIVHPSSAVNNIVNDASGNVAVGNNLTVAGTATIGGVAAVAVAPGTSGNVLTSNGTAWTSTAPTSGGAPSAIGQIPFSTNGSTYTATQKITQGTTVASTSGTSIDFTGIPSWVKRVTVILNGVSMNGVSHLLIQIGAGSVVTTGYASASYNGTAVTSTAGMIIEAGAAYLISSGAMVLTALGSNTWVSSHSVGRTNDGIAACGGGNIGLSGALDRVRITTVNGTDTFDAGSINIMYE